MSNLLYVTTVLLIIGWLIGMVGYAPGGLIHILALILISIMVGIIFTRQKV